MSGWTGQYHGKALWSIVGHSCETPDPQQDSSPRRCQKRAQRCSRNSIFGTAKFKAYTRQYKANIEGIQGKAIDVWMDRPVPWKSPVEHRGHGCETPDPQQDCSPRRCQKRAQRCSRNSIFGTAKFKAYKAIQGKYTRHRRQSHRCLDGPASTMEKPCGAPWGMVAKHRIPSRIQAQGGARSVRRDALEIASSELLNKLGHQLKNTLKERLNEAQNGHVAQRRCRYMDGTEVWIHGWDVCRGWTKHAWAGHTCGAVKELALFFPYASPSGKAEGSADMLIHMENTPERPNCKLVQALLQGMVILGEVHLQHFSAPSCKYSEVYVWLLVQVRRFTKFRMIG